jgi:hypothetical protein
MRLELRTNTRLYIPGRKGVRLEKYFTLVLEEGLDPDHDGRQRICLESSSAPNVKCNILLFSLLEGRIENCSYSMSPLLSVGQSSMALDING